MSGTPRSAYLVADARDALRAIPDDSVGIVVTSPPYLADKEYEVGWSNEMYWELISDCMEQTARVLPPGGWFCLNIGMIPQKGHPDGAHQTNVHHRMAVMMEDTGFLLDADIIWTKPIPKGKGVWRMWGSYPHPPFIYVCYGHEYILRGRLPGRREVSDESREASKLSDKEFGEWGQGIWNIRPVNSNRGNLSHPTPYPVDVPYRLIRMHSFVGDVVIDPFVGTAATNIAAATCGRHCLGVDINGEYWADARRRTTSIEFGSTGCRLRRFDDIALAVSHVFG